MSRSGRGRGREASEKASVDDAFFGGDDEGVATRRQLAAARQEIDDIVQDGLEKGHLQARPHPTLVSEKWYVSSLKPVLARWVLLLLRSPTRAAAALAGAAYAGNLGDLDDTLVTHAWAGEAGSKRQLKLLIVAVVMIRRNSEFISFVAHAYAAFCIVV